MLKMLTKPRRRKAIHIVPQDDGRLISPDDFNEAVAEEGYLYELGGGRIEVSEFPDVWHGRVIGRIISQFSLYKKPFSKAINLVAGAAEAKLLVNQSERHPDISLYLKPPSETKDVWSIWVPAIVVEIVSKSSIVRDYEVKPAEYLAFGVHEYWIVDPFKQQMTANVRWRGQWKPKIIKPSQKYSPFCLPGFALDLKRVLAAGK
jgi:Uma2 family endonuclease